MERTPEHSSDDVKMERTTEHSSDDVKTECTTEHSSDDVKTECTPEHNPGDVKMERTPEYSPGDVKMERTTEHSSDDVKTERTTEHSSDDVKTERTTEHNSDNVKMERTTEHSSDDVKTERTLEYSPDDVKTERTLEYSPDDVKTECTTEHNSDDVKTERTTEHSSDDVKTERTTDYSSGDVKMERTPDHSSDDVKMERMPEYSSDDVTMERTPEYSPHDVKMERTPVYSPDDVKMERTPEYSSDDIKMERTPVYSPDDVKMERTLEHSSDYIERTTEHSSDDVKMECTPEHSSHDVTIEHPSEHNSANINVEGAPESLHARTTNRLNSEQTRISTPGRVEAPTLDSHTSILTPPKSGGLSTPPLTRVTKMAPPRSRLSVLVKQLHKSRRSEHGVFTSLVNYIDNLISKGRTFSDDSVAALEEVLYDKMSADELVNVLDSKCLRMVKCRPLVSNVLRVLYEKQYAVPTDHEMVTKCIAVVGGRDRSRSSIPSIVASKLEADDHLGTFKRLGKLPSRSKTFASCCVSHLGFIFLFGGKQKSTFLVKTVNASWLYSPVTDTWHELPAMSMARVSFTANILPSGRHILIVGGSQQWISYSECEQFHLVKKIWNPVAPMATSRHGHASVVCNDLLYVTGGVVDLAITNTVCIYDEARNSWSDATKMLHSRSEHSAGALPGRVIVCGGTDKLLGENANYVNQNVLSVEMLDVANDQWTEVSCLPLGHYGTQPVVVNGYMYIVGGARYDDSMRCVAIPEVTKVDMTTGEAAVEESRLPASVEDTAVCCIDLPQMLMNR